MSERFGLLTLSSLSYVLPRDVSVRVTVINSSGSSSGESGGGGGFLNSIHSTTIVLSIPLAINI